MNSLQVIAHRGMFLPEGPIPQVQDNYQVKENTLKAFEMAFQKGFGIETDIRLTKSGEFIITHDSNLKRLFGENIDIENLKPKQFKNYLIPTLDELCLLAQKNQNFIAFQIKRGSTPNSGVKVGIAIAERLVKYDLRNCIIFDSTFEEARILKKQFPWLNLSVSIGEQNYGPTIYTLTQALSPKFVSVYTSAWADEWKIPNSILNKETLENLKAAYPRRLDIISPELHFNQNHPFSKDLEKLKKVWLNLKEFGFIDGVCTDYPTLLSNLLGS